MGDFRELRITRYGEEGAHDRVVDLLARLFPERSRDELASRLAITPVVISHRASPAAAEAMGKALEELGAQVRVSEAEDEQDAAAGSVEIGQDFLARRRERTGPRPMRPPRAPVDAPKAPWEED